MAVNTVARKQSTTALFVYYMPRAIILIQTDVQTLFTPMHDFEMSEFSVSLVGVVQILLPPGAFLRDGTSTQEIFRSDMAQAITSSLTSLKVNID